MSNRFAQKHNLILQKGRNVKIFLVLIINSLQLLRLKIHKWLHGIKKPVVHYYAVCWNEEKMLPFMFQYYDNFVDHYTIYDNYSDDLSEEIVKTHGNSDIVKFSMDGLINDYMYQDIKNNCWKKSRGKADFVVVCDIDEFLYHEHLVNFLKESLSEHFSIFCTTGYHMYSDTYPVFEDNKLITDKVKKGVHDFYFDKQIIFDPHRIVEINYEVGAHKAYPLGVVKEKDSHGALKMLHYKNLSLEHVLNRAHLYALRLSDINKENGWGEHYLEKEQDIRNKFKEGMSQSTQIIP